MLYNFSRDFQELACIDVLLSSLLPFLNVFMTMNDRIVFIKHMFPARRMMIVYEFEFFVLFPTAKFFARKEIFQRTFQN